MTKILWLLGYTNLSDPGTKSDNSLSSAFQLTLNGGQISLYYTFEERSSLLPLEQSLLFEDEVARDVS